MCIKCLSPPSEYGCLLSPFPCQVHTEYQRSASKIRDCFCLIWPCPRYPVLQSTCRSLHLPVRFSSPLPPSRRYGGSQPGVFPPVIAGQGAGPSPPSSFPLYVNGSAPAARGGPALPAGLLLQQMHCQSSYCTDIDPTSP